ncbi:MAG: SMP-30/gluconolactonase/LRE family protein [Alphaproteobacteria bacterium]|jgi:sugar lactone lactonase YvrE|nr:SMP-30/gluconolactonase/LRE family protein [Alphaproteobacteria bacterium]MBT7942167.1 SMP-30/gluconolactonase/LRE family protein [Alphaproteobacteria bacterium]
MEIQCLSDDRAQLGESPVWSSADNAVYWVDILGRKLHRTTLRPQQTKTWDLPSFPGMVALRRSGGLIVALQDGIYGFNPDTAQLGLLVPLETDLPENRPNDGKCDALGRLWLGTMNTVDGSRPTGNFYRIDPDCSVTKIRSDYRIPNGLAWNPDNTVMLHTDTRTNVVRSCPFDAASGACGPEKDFFHFDRATTGGVDGAAMDTSGGYWAAMYGGCKLIRVLPDGAVDTEIPLPVSQPTMPAFGGADMKTLFVTTAAQKLDENDLQSQPLAGGLLAVPVGVQGHPVYPFGG